MKRISFYLLAAAIILAAADGLYGQSQKSKGDLLKEIATLSNTQTAEARQKAYELSKEFLARFGNDTKDENVKKVRAWKEAYQIERFLSAVEARAIDDVFTLGGEILNERPDNLEVLMNLAYAGYIATGTGNKKYVENAVNSSRKAMSLMAEGKLPQTFAPFSSQAEASAYMLFIDGSLSFEKEPKQSAEKIYRSLQYETPLKNDPLPYYLIALYYEDVQAALASALKAKVEKNAISEADFKKENERVNSAIDLLLDSYARVVKKAEDQKHPNTGEWRGRFEQVYEFKNKTKEGLPEFLRFANSKPLPDPSKF
jgi:gas vesicle protein